MWWNNEVKPAVKMKEVLGARDENARERCLEVYKEKKRNLKRCIYQSKKVLEQFGRKMNQDVNGNIKLFWKEMSKVNGGKWRILTE